MTVDIFSVIFYKDEYYMQLPGTFNANALDVHLKLPDGESVYVLEINNSDGATMNDAYRYVIGAPEGERWFGENNDLDGKFPAYLRGWSVMLNGKEIWS